MSRTAHITVNAATISPAKAIMAAARSGPLLILTGRAFNELAVELGGVDAASRHLLRVATTSNRPLGVNAETATGSRTCFVAPKGWTTERLRGWVAGHHAALEAMFGTATSVPLEDL